jgi:hypothetical protein
MTTWFLPRSSHKWKLMINRCLIMVHFIHPGEPIEFRKSPLATRVWVLFQNHPVFSRPNESQCQGYFQQDDCSICHKKTDTPILVGKSHRQVVISSPNRTIFYHWKWSTRRRIRRWIVLL